MYATEDTIAGIATPHGPAPRGIIRLSGPEVVTSLTAIFRPEAEVDLSEVRSPRVISGSVTAGEMLGRVPADLYLWPSERSYTRQPSGELHTIGATPILEAVVSALLEAGVRLARPGEFTLRAFLAGRIDLTQAEAVLGIIDAASERELDIALSQLAGGLRSPLMQVRSDLLNLLAEVEAGLDFVDEDIEFISAEDATTRVLEARRQVERLLAQLKERDARTELPRVVLAGSPNAGKSSLFNALLGAREALVSEVAGTTRDYLSEEITIEGQVMILVDTAGLETEPVTGVERSGQDHAISEHSRGDVLLFCQDASAAAHDLPEQFESASGLIRVLTKCDKPTRMTARYDSWVRTSSKTGQGLDQLRRTIVERLSRARLGQDMVPCTAARCRESLSLAAESLHMAEQAGREALGDELLAQELRTALDHLGTVVGVIYTDDILDRVFSQFCIGK